MKDAGEIKHFHAHIKENYIDKDRGHLNHNDLYSVITQNKILLAFPSVKQFCSYFLV
jgi:hypothetical protein